MAATALRELARAMEANSFEPAYFLYGDEEYAKEETLRRLLATAVDQPSRDFNLDVVRGGELAPSQLNSLLRTPPLMAQRRVVVIRDVASLKKGVRTELDRYLAHPASDLLVILVADATPGASKAEKLAPAHAVAVEFAPLSDDALAKWIASHVRKALGATITEEAIGMLHGAIGNDLSRLASELEKLANYARGGEIDAAAVSAIVGVERGRTLGDLLDRVAARDAAGAFALIEPVLAMPKTSAVPVVMALATQTIALAWGRAQRDGGVSASRLSGMYFDFLKRTGGGMTGRPWGEAVRAWSGAVDRWTPRALERALDVLLQADITLKDTRVSAEEQVLGTVILALCRPDSAD